MHYRGKKYTYNNIEFDSSPEKDYYIKLMNDKGVSNLQVHPKFILLDGLQEEYMLKSGEFHL
ncbi:DUF1064 domain-containing protein [Clostridium botulinum]|nr:DUF1064 domain-containing protein [Clostridium botulinum]NFS52953.1 DUF1064 domain-containing protein [Clostridium botulinum]NFT16475.1 DUF1064 domain-containing protein [Clostridium botulinum]